jgi:putative membrane protein
MTLFSNSEEAAIAEAIAAAERATSGEIVAVVARESGTYLFAPILYAALIALLIPWPFIYLTWFPVQWIYLAQLVGFALIALALSPRRLRLALVPRSMKHERAHRRAVEQFLVQNLATTKGRTGVLIFVSIAERYAEIIPDAGISAKVPESEWQAIVDRLTGSIGSGRPAKGFIDAITSVGRHLAGHFPPGSAAANELPNHLIVLA